MSKSAVLLATALAVACSTPQSQPAPQRPVAKVKAATATIAPPPPTERPRKAPIPRPTHRTASTPPPPQPPPKRRSPVDGVWARLAMCESGGRWNYNGSSGYDGGLQFHPRTWDAYKPEGYPRYAYQASPQQQIAVAKLVLAAQGWGAWPACSRKLGLR